METHWILTDILNPFFADIVELFLLDCSGKEVYMDLLSEMMKNVDMIVAIYDVTKSESFGHVTKVGWILFRIVDPVLDRGSDPCFCQCQLHVRHTYYE